MPPLHPRQALPHLLLSTHPQTLNPVSATPLLCLSKAAHSTINSKSVCATLLLCLSEANHLTKCLSVTTMPCIAESRNPILQQAVASYHLHLSCNSCHYGFRTSKGSCDMAEQAGEQQEQKHGKGAFVRPDSGHRNWIRADGSSQYKPEKGRYHLYISNNCPWCHRSVATTQACVSPLPSGIKPPPQNEHSV